MVWELRALGLLLAWELSLELLHSLHVRGHHHRIGVRVGVGGEARSKDGRVLEGGNWSGSFSLRHSATGIGRCKFVRLWYFSGEGCGSSEDHLPESPCKYQRINLAISEEEHKNQHNNEEEN
jgi:hypothetical protein